MSVSVITSATALSDLREDWDHLALEPACPVFEHDWFSACAEAFYPETSLRIVVARECSVVTGIAPLALEPTALGKRLALMGASWLHEPGSWLFASNKAIAELGDQVVRLGHPIVLQRIPERSALTAALLTSVRGRSLSAVRSTAPSLAVNTSGCWEDYYSSLSSLVRKNLPRVRRRAEKAFGPVQVTHTEPQPEEVDEVLAKFVGVESSGWKGRRGSALRDRRVLRDFFSRYCSSAAARRRLRVATLSFGSQIAAMELSVEAYGRMWQLKIGYDESVAEFYPGLHLTEASIRAAFARGLASYEFLGVAEPWEDRWRPEPRNYQLLLLYPLSTRGIIGACGDAAGTVWRRVGGIHHARTALGVQ